jgi:RNA polymerase sigma-70 factor, ECF subfamily
MQAERQTVNRNKLDHERIKGLYDQHARVMLAYAASLLPDRAASEDVLHQVFTKLLQGGRQINGSPVPYLYRAIRNAAFNYRRDRSREVGLESEGSEACWIESPRGLEELGLAIESALRELPAEQREVIVLHVWGQMTFEEAAAALDISANTAASRYRYGLAKLKERLKPLAKEQA